MAVYKKGKNWYIDYYVRGRRKRKKIGPSKKLAEQVLKDIQVKIAKGEYLGIFEDRKIPFARFVQEYLEYSRANKRPSTYRRDRTNVRNLLAAFEGHYLSEITPKMVEEYKARRLERVSQASVNREITCLKHMYTKAVEWGYVQRNPIKGVKRLKEPPGRLRYLTREEVTALLEACNSHLRPIVVMALNTGMRKGEILSLRWRDIDLKNRRITLRNTKTNEIRVIPINETLYRELLQLDRCDEGEYVFCNARGEPYGDVKKGFASALRKAGIKDFRFHDLRHTFGSHLVMQGVDLRTVQQLMGHKEIKMTMRYAHLSPEHVEEAVARLDSLWTPYGHQSQDRESRVVVSP